MYPNKNSQNRGDRNCLPSCVSTRPRKQMRTNLNLCTRSIILRTLLIGYQTLAAKIRRPSRCVVETTVPKIRPKTSRLTSCPTTARGYSSERCRGVTISNASAQTQTGTYHIPSAIYSPTRRDTHRPENLSRDQPTRRDSDFPTTVHSGPLNLPTYLRWDV